MKITALENREKQLRHQSIIKESNLKRIFDLIFENEDISRIEISRRMNMSRSAVSVLVDELVYSGLVRMSGERDSTSSGRKPVGLEINAGRFRLIVISLKKESFRSALLDLRGNEIESFSGNIRYNKGFGTLIRKAILDSFRKVSGKKLIALCASIPARIDISRKTVDLSILNVQDSCDMLEELKAIIPKVPLLAANMSSAYVYAEYKCGVSGKDDIIYFYIDEGVAAGIIINGRVFTGEIGHMSIDANGPLCSCGKRGCLENEVNRASIIREFGGRSYKSVRKALEEGDPEALRIAGEIARKIGFGISNVICMFNPGKIVLGGGIEELGPVFLQMILRNVRFPGTTGNDSIISYSGLGQYADTAGIFRYFMDNIFSISTEIDNRFYGWN
jgi:predicted NBD/HSP70 family sugar kinase